MRSPSPQQKLPEQTSWTDFRRNQAEQDLRMLKAQQKIAGSFRADSGSVAFARIRGCLSSLRTQGVALLAALEPVFPGQPLSPEAGGPRPGGRLGEVGIWGGALI
jgi:hypothetical protein